MYSSIFSEIGPQISQAVPPDLQNTVNNLVDTGKTLQQLVDYLQPTVSLFHTSPFCHDYFKDIDHKYCPLGSSS